MNREADVLEDGVEVLALHRRQQEARERVGSQKDEGEERRRDPGLDRQDVRLQARRQVTPEQRDERSEEAQDQHPQKHRALVVSPHARHLVEHRLERMGILVDVEDREVGRDMREGQRREGEGEEHEAAGRGDRSRLHQPGVAGARADRRQRRLHQRHRQRQDQRVVTDFDDHAPSPAATTAPLAGVEDAVGPPLAPFADPSSTLLSTVPPLTMPLPSSQRPRAFRSSTTSLGM